jgi:uncharacterized membrane protein YhiD involved in acid resistance
VQESLWHLLAATLIGFAVGLERERAKVERQGSTIGGCVPSPCWGLLGGVSALGQNQWLPAVAGLAVYTLTVFKTALSFGTRGLGLYVALGLLPGGLLALLMVL